MFGRGETNETPTESLMIDGAYDQDSFVARYKPDGSLDWVMTFRNPTGDYEYSYPDISDVTGYADGSFAVVGGYNFDMEIAGPEVLEYVSTRDSSPLFVARFDPNGVLEWLKHTTDDVDILTYTRGTSIDGFEDGSLVVAGLFSESTIFASGEPGETTLEMESSDTTDIFIARFDRDGGLVFAKQAGGVGKQFIEEAKCGHHFFGRIRSHHWCLLQQCGIRRRRLGTSRAATERQRGHDVCCALQAGRLRSVGHPGGH